MGLALSLWAGKGEEVWCCFFLEENEGNTYIGRSRCIFHIFLFHEQISLKNKHDLEREPGWGSCRATFLPNCFSFSYYVSCIWSVGRELVLTFCCCIRQMGLELCGLIGWEVAFCLLSVGDKGAFSPHRSFWNSPSSLVLEKRVGEVGGEKRVSGAECIYYTYWVLILWAYWSYCSGNIWDEEPWWTI